ncbi:hypothetical protein CGRA01v4_00611 [Colletotrichum graminicola]|nr:hypothetical protein CGRA01v4_00611 [Colletotrichum graminicola]
MPNSPFFAILSTCCSTRETWRVAFLRLMSARIWFGLTNSLLFQRRGPPKDPSWIRIGVAVNLGPISSNLTSVFLPAWTLVVVSSEFSSASTSCTWYWRIQTCNKRVSLLPPTNTGEAQRCTEDMEDLEHTFPSR